MLTNKKFSPELLPNNKAGDPLDIETAIADPSEWLYSLKLDGGRVEIFGEGPSTGRSLKEITSVHIQRMVKDIQLILQLPPTVIIEAEFYSHEMNFAEIMHFFRSEDVTGDRSVKKWSKEWEKTAQGTSFYLKKAGDVMVEQYWQFPGRDLDWVTSWHKSLKFYVFNVVDTAEDSTFEERVIHMDQIMDVYWTKMGTIEWDMISIQQQKFDHVDRLYQAYDQAIMDGYEGLVVHKRSAPYKFGRQTLNSNTVYKLKNDDIEFDGVILSVEEGTVAREGTQKTINELGRSKTSQLQEDRVPSGMAKGFLVRMDDGRELTVSLKDYNHSERRHLLHHPEDYVGQTIRFTGMEPVKPGGMPRQAHYTKGNIRDEK